MDLSLQVIHMNNKPSFELSQVKKSWVEFLGRFNWVWFITLTFKNPINESRADKLSRVFMNKFNQAIYGRHCKGLFYIRVKEYQLRGVIHYHILAGGFKSEVFNPYPLKEWWYSKFGIARVEKIKDRTRSINYLLKYVLKKDQDLILIGLEHNGLPTPVLLGHTGIEERPGVGGKKVFFLSSLSLEALLKVGVFLRSNAQEYPVS